MKTLLLLFLLTAAKIGFAQTGFNDNTFNSADTSSQLLFNGNVSASFKDDLGRIYIAGSSNSQMMIMRLLPNGEKDNSFNAGAGPNNWIKCMALQPDGKIIITGDFTSFDGNSVAKIARLNNDGSFDNTFQSNSYNSQILTIEIGASGKIYLGGTFTNFSSTGTKNIIRLNNNGSIDNTFLLSSLDFNYSNIQAIEELPSGKIVIGGVFTTYMSTACQNLIQLNNDGSVDTGFDVSSTVNGVVSDIQAVGSSLLVSGNFQNYGTNTVCNLIKLNSNGTLDATFNQQFGINATIAGITLLSSGEIIVFGPFTSYQNNTKKGISKLSANGLLVSSFNPVFYDNINDIIELSDFGLFCSGDFYSVNGVMRSGITKLNTNGTLNHTFDAMSGFSRYASRHYVYPDGRILIGGGFTAYNDMPAKGMIRLFSDGTIDPSFHIADSALNVATFVEVADVTVQADGKIIAVGDFTSIGNFNRNRIVRLLDNGQVDTSFHIGTGFNNSVACVALQADGKILVGGDFTSYNGVTTNKICRLLPNGTKRCFVYRNSQ